MPLHRTLTFVGAEWPLFFRKPLQSTGFGSAGRPNFLADLIAEPGPVGTEEVERIACQLAEKLPSEPRPISLFRLRCPAYVRSRVSPMANITNDAQVRRIEVLPSGRIAHTLNLCATCA